MEVKNNSCHVAHRSIGADRSFVTVGRSFTVAKGFSPLRKGGFTIPFMSGLGAVLSGLAPGVLTTAVILEGSSLASELALVCPGTR